MRIFVWLFRAAIFFSLFAFALNNQHDATVKWFFGVGLASSSNTAFTIDGVNSFDDRP